MEDVAHRPVWFDLDPPDRPQPTATVEGRYDIVVVGAGIAGLSCALHAAQSGASVLVLEREFPGAGATGRNAGFLMGEGECMALSTAAHGLEAAATLATIGRTSRWLIGRLDPPPRHLSWPGGIKLAASVREADALIDTEDALEDYELLDDLPPEAGPTERAERRYRVALLDPGDGLCHPLHVVDSLLRALAAAGGRVAFPADVTGLERDGTGWSVRVGDSAVRAEHVVLARAVGAADLVPPAGRPVRAQALAAVCDPVPDWTRSVYASEGGDYWRPLPDGRVLVGGRRRMDLDAEETAALDTTPTVQASLDELLRDLLPDGTTVQVTHRWSGTMVFSPDELPIAGELPTHPHLHQLGGFTGAGMCWGPALGALLAGQIVSGETRVPPPFAADRFSR